MNDLIAQLAREVAALRNEVERLKTQESGGGYLLATGTRTGASSQAQTFTNGIIGPTWKPAADSTTAIKIQTAAGGDFATFNTTNRRVSLGDGNTPAAALLSTDALTLSGTSVSLGLAIVVASATAGNRGIFKAVRARGTLPTPTAASSGDSVFSLLGSAYDGSTTQNTALVEMLVDGAVSAGVAPQRIIFVTGATDSASRDERMAIKSDGKVHIGLGAGGSPTALLHVAASTTARASLRLGAGSRPTTPNTGDIWDDGALTTYQINATTNAVVNSLRLERGSSGTPAAGFGLGITAQLESSTTDSQDAGRLTWAWSTATHASRASVGKLTAYYTTSEREVITWTATSSAATVDIAASTTTFSAANAKININATSGLPEVTFSAAGVSKWSMYYNSTYFTIAETGVGETMKFTNGGQITTTGGNFGIGVGSPQAILHAHDGSGGFMIVNRSGVGGSLVTVIPDGTGDVTENISFFGWVSNSSGVTFQVGDGYLAVSNSTTKTDGVNTLTIAVTAVGAFTLQATAGAATWKVCLWAFWR